MQYAASLDGVRIAYLSLGRGAPLVFASNIFGDATRYADDSSPHVRTVADRLVALGWRVVLFDHRGMGASDRSVTDFSLEARVRDLVAVVTALQLERFALAAVDIGGATAIAYAVANPAAVSHLVLLSPWASGARYMQLPALRAAFSAEPVAERELFAKILEGVASGFKDPDYVERRAAAFLRVCTPEALSAFNAATARIHIRDLLARVTAPTLVTHEPSFPFGSFELCQEVAAGIPNSEFLVVNENSIAGRVHEQNISAIARFLRSGTATPSTTVGGDTATHHPAFEVLTPRERQVLREVAGGATNKAIAAALGLAVPTVERHLVNLYTKIGARGRADAIAYALRHELDDRSS